MALSVNPLAKLVATASQSVSQASNAAGGALSGVKDAVGKANLDAKVAALSGSVGSALNGATSGGAGGLTSKLGGMTSALGGLGSAVQTKVGGAIGGLQSALGSTSNITADIAGGLNKIAGGQLAGGLMNLASGISGAAGMLNNVLSLARGKNLPAGAEVFAKQGTAIKLQPGSKDDWRVRITCQWDIFKSPLFDQLEKTGGVVWPFNPNITVSTKANYSQIDVVHSNYPFYSYKNSSVDDITISGEFPCETEVDAGYWIAATTFFKTATKMFYGESSPNGNPPIVCNLSGYGSSIFNNVPVIIKSFSVDLKDDVNYIRYTPTNTWVPIMSNISVVVVPIYNRASLRKFNLATYASGKMVSTSGVGYL